MALFDSEIKETETKSVAIATSKYALCSVLLGEQDYFQVLITLPY